MVRRSTRARKSTQQSFQDPSTDDEFQAPPTPTRFKKTPTQKTSSSFEPDGEEDPKGRVRRAPKRKATSQAHAYGEDIPSTIVEDSLAPIKPEEREQWNQWVEIESDPAFFTFILNELGAKDVIVQDVCALDEAFIEYLPKPIYGLIFLYQYFDDNWGEDRPPCPDHVWFANQAVDNACATVALLNIIMNSGIVLGEELETLRDQTKSLSPPLRGWCLSKNSFIRNIHNSFTSRNDFLNAELRLQNKFDKHNTKGRASKSTSTSAPKGKKQKRRQISKQGFSQTEESGYHFIAYVPIKGAVWELDGLQYTPRCIGKYAKEDWISAARPSIEARMVDHELFNLLALCSSRPAAVRAQLASNIRALDYISSLLSIDQAPKHLKQLLPPKKKALWITPDDEIGLHSLGLTSDAVREAAVPLEAELPLNHLAELIAYTRENSAISLESALKSSIVSRIDFKTIIESLYSEHRRLKVEYINESASQNDFFEKAVGRKRDYGPAIHLWLKKLAENGALREIVEGAK